MRCKTWWVKVIRADHGFNYSHEYPEKSARTCNILGQIAAKWMTERDPELNEMTVDWEGPANPTGRPIWTDWRAPAPESLPETRFNITVPPGAGGNFSISLSK
jgi:hypothetical protein